MVVKDILERVTDTSIVSSYEVPHFEVQDTNPSNADADGSKIDDSKGSQSNKMESNKFSFRLSPSEAMELPQHCSSLYKLSTFPTWNYLNLREEQNSAWANTQFEKGVEYAKAALSADKTQLESLSLVKKAESCYKDGLEMIPHHKRILTAYGALCINDGRLEMAHEMLKRVIDYINQESDVNGSSEEAENKATLKDAKTYLAVVESKLHGQKQAKAQAIRKETTVQMSSRAEQRMNDALAEQSFLSGDGKISRIGTSKKYELLSSSEDSVSSASLNKKKRKHKRSSHENRKHSRKRKKDYRSQNSSDSESEDSYEKRKRRKHRKGHKKKKKRYSKSKYKDKK